MLVIHSKLAFSLYHHFLRKVDGDAPLRSFDSGGYRLRYFRGPFLGPGRSGHFSGKASKAGSRKAAASAKGVENWRNLFCHFLPNGGLYQEDDLNN